MTLNGPHGKKDQHSNRTRTTTHRNDYPRAAGKEGQWRPKQDGGSSKPPYPMDLDQEIEAQEAQELSATCERAQRAHVINGPFTIDPLPFFPKLKSIENTLLNPNSESLSTIPCRNLEEDELQDQQDL